MYWLNTFFPCIDWLWQWLESWPHLPHLVGLFASRMSGSFQKGPCEVPKDGIRAAAYTPVIKKETAITSIYWRMDSFGIHGRDLIWRATGIVVEYYVSLSKSLIFFNLKYLGFHSALDLSQVCSMGDGGLIILNISGMRRKTNPTLVGYRMRRVN